MGIQQTMNAKVHYEKRDIRTVARVAWPSALESFFVALAELYVRRYACLWIETRSDETMWKKWKTALTEKIDVKITGYISAAMFGVAVIALFYVIGLSAGAAGALPLWSAYAGFGIIVFCWLAILLSKWGQRQTGRRLKINRTAVWLNGCLIGVMALIYILGIVFSV